MADRWVDEPVPCFDPECAEVGGMAEPESDGDLRYYACTTCGYEGGYEQVRQDAGGCQLGIPEEIRVKYSASQPPGVVTLEAGSARRSVFLGTTIGRRPQ